LHPGVDSLPLKLKHAVHDMPAVLELATRRNPQTKTQTVPSGPAGLWAPDQPSFAPTFSLEEFVENIKKGIAAHPGLNKASFAAMVGSKSLPDIPITIGFPRRNPNQAMSIHQPMHLASVSKMFTAAAVLRAILDSNDQIDVGSPIHHYFPSIWPGPSARFKKITFKDSLQYRNGINGQKFGTTTLAAIRDIYAGNYANYHLEEKTFLEGSIITCPTGGLELLWHI